MNIMSSLGPEVALQLVEDCFIIQMSGYVEGYYKMLSYFT